MNQRKRWFFYMRFFPILIFIAIVTMSIGYATINSINLNVSGSASGLFQTYNDIYIRSATVSSKNGEKINFNGINGLMLNTSLSLVKQSSSTVSMVVTLFNPSQNTYKFNGVIYAKDLVSSEPNIYSNSNIVYSYSSSKSEVGPNESVKVTITFSYKSYTSSSSQNLNSILSIDFAKIKETVVDKLNGSNSVALYDAERSDEGIVFNGDNSYAIFENSYKFPLTYSITFKTNLINGVVFGDYDTKAGLGFLGNRLILNVGNGNDVRTAEFLMNSSLSIGEWHTLDFLYTSVSQQRVFVDGVEITKRSSSTNYWVWGDSVSYIGMRPISNNYTTAYHFDGVLKRFLIYNRLLSDNEIIQNYNTENPNDLIQDSLVTHFEFGN